VNRYQVLKVKWALALLALSGGVLSAGCAGSGHTEAQATAARAAAIPNWKIQLEWAGSTVEASIERMDIYLVDDESYPEIFEIMGDDAVLVGELPTTVHVGYGEDWQRIFGVPIAIRASGGDPRETKTSWVRLNGVQVPVSGGTIRFEKITGKWNGSEGDKTLWGTIELRVPGADGEKTVTGKIAANAVTWG